jgi:hypothetical protein
MNKTVADIVRRDWLSFGKQPANGSVPMLSVDSPRQ